MHRIGGTCRSGSPSLAEKMLMLESARYAAAISFAARAHKGQTRKGTSIPYITHPLAVSGLVVEFGGDEDQAIAGLLHDVVEDCDVQLDVLAEMFGHRVADIVEGCTDGTPQAGGEKAPWLERKGAHLSELFQAPTDLLLVAACDKLHNLRSIMVDIEVVGLSVFDRFSATPAQIEWYYRSMADLFLERLGQARLPLAVSREVDRVWSCVYQSAPNGEARVPGR